MILLVKVSLIGCGYWGPNYVRVVNELEGLELNSCCDLEEANLNHMKKMSPHIKTTKDYHQILNNSSSEAVIITTPPETHYKITRDCLESGKHVLVEKPLVTKINEGKKLIKLSHKVNRKLMVGHIYLFNPGIHYLKEMIEEGEIGQIFYLDSVRIGLGPIRKQANALWDLATHDISISLYLLNSLPEKVSATGAAYLSHGVEDITNLTLEFPGKIIHNIHTSWFSPEKVRKMRVVGSEKMAVFDDVKKTEMVKIYEREVDRNRLNSSPEYVDHQSILNIGDTYIPNIKQSEPLKNQVKHFLECLSQDKDPLTNGQEGLDVVKVLVAAEKALAQGGATCL